MIFGKSGRQADLESSARQLHELCLHAPACDRVAEMHGAEVAHIWLRCAECDVYEDEHCPMLLSGMMRCKGAGR